MTGADRGSMRDRFEAARRELEDAMNAELGKSHDGSDDQRDGPPPQADQSADQA